MIRARTRIAPMLPPIDEPDARIERPSPIRAEVRVFDGRRIVGEREKRDSVD